MGIVGAITGQNSMQTQAASQQQSLQALEMQARQMLDSGNIPPMNLTGVQGSQLQGVLNGLVSQAQSAGTGTAVDTLSRYRIQELMTYAQHLGVQLTIPQNLPVAQAPSASIGGYPQLQQPAQQQAPYAQSSGGYEEYQLGMGIPGYGLDVGGTHFDYGSMTDSRMYQLMLASGGTPGTSSTPSASYGASAYPTTSMAGYGQTAAYGASAYPSTAMTGYGSAMGQTSGYGAAAYPSTAMAGYGSTMGQTAGYGAAAYPSAAMTGYGQASPYGAAAYPNAAMTGYGPTAAYGANPYAAPQTGSNVAGVTDPQGGYAILSAIGGSVGTGLTSDAIRDLGTTISTSGMGASAGGLGGLGFLAGGSSSAIGAGYGTTPSYGATAGYGQTAGLGAMAGYGSAAGYGSMAGYGAQPNYSAYSTTSGLNGLGGLGSLGGINGLGAMGGGTMNIGSSYGGTSMLTPQQAGLQYGF